MVLGYQFGRWAVGGVALLMGAQALAEAPKTPKASKTSGPSVRITLESIHAPGVSPNFLRAGASMLTVNLLDDTHLLVTFATKDLVPRLPDDPKEDEDRIVAAEVVEVPSGKVLAQTRWHMHDHARYLWPIGEGRYVVRIGASLSVMAPLERMNRAETAKTPFERVALPHQKGTPVGVVRTADAELISVITELSQGKKPVVNGDAETPHREFAIDFYRLHGAPDGSVELTGAGVVRSAEAFALPMDGDGYLWPADDSGRGHWAISFNGFGGKTIPAGTLDSSCAPRLAMASKTQYIALTCRGREDLPKLQAMGLDGYEPWEENLSEMTEAPSFVFAPAAGRFAMLYSTTYSAPAGPQVETTTGTNQEVRVYQTESGDLLQRVPCSPQFRVPENFDLSASGKTLAVLHDAEILIYTLPELSKKDREDLAETAKFRPPSSDAPVTLGRMVRRATDAAAATEEAQSEKKALAVPDSTTTQAQQTAPAKDKDAAAVATQRQRPTLLNPGEKPEFKDKNNPVQ